MFSNHKLVGAIVLIGVGVLMWSNHHGPVTPWQIVGALIALPSGMLWMVARLQLGQSFAVRAEARQLVTTGLYSKIRNPIYVFGLLFITGIFIYLGHFLWLWVVPALAALQYWRVRAESAVLEAKFGDEYRQYRARTWF